MPVYKILQPPMNIWRDGGVVPLWDEIELPEETAIELIEQGMIADPNAVETVAKEPQPFAISNPPLLVTIASRSFQLWQTVWLDPTVAEPLLEAGLIEATAAVPIAVDSVEEIADEDSIPPFVSGIPDIEPIVPTESSPPANIVIPDLDTLNAEEAIAAINGITGEDEATVLALLLDSEEAGKKRKTVIAAIKERAGFAI